MDLVIRNGTVVGARGRAHADVGIEGESIVAVGADLPRGAHEIDARGLLVLPGGIDVHTHLDMPVGDIATADDVASGTRAAAAGGVTTVVDFAVQAAGTTLAETLDTWRDKARGNAWIDYAFHLAVTDWNDAVRSEIPGLITAGYPTFKAFMAYRGALMLEDRDLFALMQTVGACGGMVLVHCEHGDVIEALRRDAVARGDTAPRFHALTRPPAVEAEATERAIVLAHLAGARLYVVHVSCAEALHAVSTARAAGRDVHAETCPQYLGAITIDDYDRPGFEGAAFVCSPPLRTSGDATALWHALRAGVLTVVSSDHSPFTTSQKRRGENDFTKIPNGVPGIETRMALTWSLGVHGGHVTPERFVDIVATEPARRFGFVRKGELLPGFDADVVLFDPERPFVVRASDLHQRVDHTPYEGFAGHGRPVATIARGERVWSIEDGFTGRQGRGREVLRSL